MSAVCYRMAIDQTGTIKTASASFLYNVLCP